MVEKGRDSSAARPRGESARPAAFQQFRFFVERLGQHGSAAGTCEEREVLALDGASSLLLVAGELALVAGLRTDAIGLAPIRIEDQTLLTMTVPDGFDMKVNGIAAGPTRVLSVKDVLELSGGGHVLHLTAYNHPYLGPALPEHVGLHCPICTTEIKSTSRVIQCVFCGATYHDGAVDPSAAEEPLECAKTVAMCTCPNALVREVGYAYEPV